MYVCSKCGTCCRNLKLSELYADLDRGDGVCKFLQEDNLCSIYSNRPDKCNIDKMYELLFKNVYSKDDYYAMNYKSCKYLRENHSKG